MQAVQCPAPLALALQGWSVSPCVTDQQRAARLGCPGSLVTEAARPLPALPEPAVRCRGARVPFIEPAGVWTGAPHGRGALGGARQAPHSPPVPGLTPPGPGAAPARALRPLPAPWESSGSSLGHRAGLTRRAGQPAGHPPARPGDTAMGARPPRGLAVAGLGTSGARPP